MTSTEFEAVKHALSAIFYTLSEKQQNEIRQMIMRDVTKHDLPGEAEKLAVEILRGL